MQEFCASDTNATNADECKGSKLNAYRKVCRLRQRRAPIFWAVGPRGVSNVFRVSYRQDGSLGLAPENEKALVFPGA